MASPLYYDGTPWAGITAWHLRALYKVGQAGRRGRLCLLPAGPVRSYLLGAGLIMKGEPGRYMLTSFGQSLFVNIKKRKNQAPVKAPAIKIKAPPAPRKGRK